ncbi:MAG: hypothetical protein QNI86_04910 [Halieaceae bacterium]|nr:hypothetical protein [Halieaceae bacterium]
MLLLPFTSPRMRHLILAMLLPLPALADTQEPPEEEESWVDSRYETVSKRADDLAIWVDNFFGHPREVEDEARSQIRIRPQVEWDEQDGWDVKLRATGRLRLPRTSDRLSLVFTSQDDDFDGEFYDPSIATDRDSAAGIQYQVRGEKRSAAYLFAGAKSGPNIKLGGRYIFQDELVGTSTYRFSEEVFWVGGDGFTSRTRLDLNQPLSENTLLRWANRVDYGEETNGAEWVTRLAWIRRFDQRSAVRLFGFVRGETDPEILKARGFGAGFRRRYLRDWFFIEIEPSYAWRKRRPDQDREGVAQVKVRFEIIIGER